MMGIENENTNLKQFVDTSLVELVTDEIKKRIHTGQLAPGEKLIVRRLSEELNVSHTPIKEALNRLVAEGYVEALPRKSMRVRIVSHDEMQEIMESRAMMELYAIPSIIKRSISDVTYVKRLEHYISQMDDVLMSNEVDYFRWLDCDMNFHQAYISAVNNQVFLGLYVGLRANRSSYFGFLNETHQPLTKKHLQMDQKEHIQIFENIASHNFAGVMDAISNHILRSRIQYGTGNDEIRGRIQQYMAIYKRGEGLINGSNPLFQQHLQHL